MRAAVPRLSDLERVGQQAELVVQPVQESRVHDRIVRDRVAQAFAQRDQAAHEVAAVDRGDVERVQRVQVCGVVPVVEVTVIAGQLRQRLRGCGRRRSTSPRVVR